MGDHRHLGVSLALLAALTANAFPIAGRESLGQTTLRVPGAWSEWYLLAKCDHAKWIMSDEATPLYIVNTVKEAEWPYEDRTIYQAGQTAEVLSRSSGCVLVKLNAGGAVGYLATSLADLTPKERQSQAKAQREMAAKRIADQKEWKRLEDERWQKIKQNQLTCSALYRETSNKKVSDLTVKQSQTIQACTALGFYKP